MFTGRVVLLSVLAAAAGISVFAAAPAKTAEQARVPVLLELFTSEGCSSCPPADRLLESFDRTQPVPGADVIVLSEHVDYWNNLGWRDPFSARAFSIRQREYASQFKLDEVFTPQLVIDGAAEMVGSNERLALAEIRKAAERPSTGVALSGAVRQGGRIRVHVSASKAPADLTVLVALAENQTRSTVTAGENSGHQLTNVAAVRTLKAVATVAKGEAWSKNVELPVKAGVGANGLRIVVFLQEQATGRIAGAAQLKL